MKLPLNTIVITLAFLLFTSFSHSQMITGVWHGKINGQKAEVKIIQKGDSLTGTSYYYASEKTYRRYSIKGYFAIDNTVVWWDDQLLEDKNGSSKAWVSEADFNCPGGGIMKLDGKAAPKQDPENPKGNVNLTKVEAPSFPDEWDFVIDNYIVGANDPYVIDSVQFVASRPIPRPDIISPPKQTTEVVTKATVPKPEPPVAVPPKTIEEKFVIRKKVFTTEIPIEGDSIELRFFDNVEVDGDSITLFLNDKMIFTHIKLTEKPFIVKLPVKELNDTNELTMVAENLGAIPPNTAYMVAIVGTKRYEVNLSSTEETSGMIRLKKARPPSEAVSKANKSVILSLSKY